jgi:hypothetical protein
LCALKLEIRIDGIEHARKFLKGQDQLVVFGAPGGVDVPCAVVD